MEDKVKIRCPGCTKLFRERAGKVRDGVQLNCPNCYKLLTLHRDSEDKRHVSFAILGGATVRKPKATLIEPTFYADIEYWASDALLRASSFKGLSKRN
jgi:uncharacterized C2H2 Zn-finger protein